MQWPLPTFGSKQAIANRNASSGLATVVPQGSATPHVKGLWLTVIASTGAVPAYGIFVWMLLTNAAADTSTLLDIGFGSAGNETAIISNMVIGSRTTSRQLAYIPMYIPANTRISARVQSVQASKNVTICIDVNAGEPANGASTPSKFTTYGASTATSTGVTVAPNATLNTFGAWTELTPSTTAPIHELLTYQACASGNTTQTAANYLMEFGIGSAGNETTLVKGLASAPSASVFVETYFPMWMPLGLNVPVGSRISARLAASANSATSLAVSLIGITY